MEVGLIVISVLASVTNAAVIIMVIAIKELRTFNNVFVASLAVSDMLTGAVLVPLHLADHYEVSGFLSFTIMISGVLNLCAVTWDRYVAVTDPFGYKDKLQKCHGKLLFAIWTTASLSTLIPLAWDNDITTEYHKWFLILSLLILVLIPYGFIVAAYVRIWLRLRSHAAQMKQVSISNEQREGARRASLEGKTVKVFLVVVSVFLVSWLPVIYMTTVGLMLGRLDLIPPHLSMLSWYTITGSSLINPILYGIMKRDFYVQFRRLCSSIVDPWTSPT
ncbi:D(4) dopamine receptor-like [Exaiptasia diaphana]|uniref:G-protein coupled receptors family 1 profile domain-containing protein n=1 Tax=Exaiptasia diaphana TaxID=2652724 RepID=A0A913XU77_EXADI|nr:D(4) dopamine receptor-like [Exaiptasia diaphana]